jgi:HK97 family phage major capsid protein
MIALGQSVLATDNKELEAKRIGTFMYVTNDLLEDTTEDVGLDVFDLIFTVLTEQIGKKVDLTLWQGDTGGDHTYMDGVTVDSNCGSYELAAGEVNFSDIVGRDLRFMIAQVPPEQRAGCAFFMCSDAAVYVDTLEDDNGNPIYRAPAGDKPATLYGYPYHETTYFPDNDGEDAKSLLAYGSLSKNCLFGVRNEIRIESTKVLKLLENMTTVKIEAKFAMMLPHPSRWINLLSNAS